MSNPLRDQMVRRAVTRTQHESEEVTIENVRKYLPGPHAGYDAKLREQEDFLLDADDLAPYLPAPAEPVEPEPVKDASGHDPQPVEPPKPVEPPQVRYVRLDAKAIELEHERANLRVTYDVAIRDELAARLELDKIARTFMAGFGAPMTPDQLLKQHAASEAETRRKIAAGELPGRRAHQVGPSVLDKYAAAQRGGAPGFAGRGYARGGQSVSKRIMPFGIAERPKLPSER
jgi:hypothetical protein